jgi:hypothetical protein
MLAAIAGHAVKKSKIDKGECRKSYKEQAKKYPTT